MAVEVDSAANVIVRAPRWSTKGEIEAFILLHWDWIEKHVKKAKKEMERTAALGKFSESDLKSMGKEAKKTLPPRVMEIAEAMGITYNKLSFRKQRTRWGSCNSKGNISLNCLLVKVPEEVRDYVIIHELAHRKHMNHSKAFWSLVEKYDPKFRDHRKWLRTEGRDLIAMLG